MQQYHYDMLLFCIQITDNGCMMYFVNRHSLQSGDAELFRFGGPKSMACKVFLGGVYTLLEGRCRIKTFNLESRFKIAEPYFVMLNKLRTLKYEHKNYNPDDFYSFDELRKLLEYNRSFARVMLEGAVCVIMYLLSMILPVALYVIYMFLLIKSNAQSAVAVPFISIGALVFMLYFVAVAFVFCQWLLLILPFTRYGLMRASALKLCGAKRPIGITTKMIKTLTFYGIVSLSVFLLTQLTLLF